MDTLSQHPDAGWWANGWVDLALRWLLGGLFVLASAHKIMDPAAFAKIIFGYDLFPAAAINLIAIILPYIELTAGLALITGVYPRAAAVILGERDLDRVRAAGVGADPVARKQDVVTAERRPPPRWSSAPGSSSG